MSKQLQFFLGELKAVLRENINSPSNPFTSVGYLIRIFLDPKRLIKLFDPLVWRIVLSYTFNPPGLNRRMKILRFLNLTIKSGIFFVVSVLIYRANYQFNNQTLVARKRFFELVPPMRNWSEPQNDTLKELVGSSNVDRLLISLLSPPQRIKTSGMLTQREILGDYFFPKTEEAETEEAKIEEAETEEAKIEEAETEEAETEEAKIEEAETEEAETEEAETEEAETEEAETEEAKIEEAETEEAETEEAKIQQAKDPLTSRLWQVFEQFTRNKVLEELTPNKVLEQLTRNRTYVSSLLSDLWVELRLSKRVTRDQKLLKKENNDFAAFNRAQNREIVKLFRIIPYLHNTVSIHPIPSDPISGYDKMIEFEQRFVARLLDLAETLTDPTDSEKLCRDRPVFTCEKYGLEWDVSDDVFKGPHWVEQRMILLVIPPSISENKAIYYRREGKKELNIVVFANNKIMEAVNQYRLIRNLIQSTAYRSIRNVLNRFFRNFEFIISKFITSKFITTKTYNPHILWVRTVGNRMEDICHFLEGEGSYDDSTDINSCTGKKDVPNRLPHFLFPVDKSLVYSIEFPLRKLNVYEAWEDYKYSGYPSWLKALKDFFSDQNRPKFSFVLSNPFVFVSLKNWTSFFLDDHDHEPCQKISRSMLYSFYEDLKKKPEEDLIKSESLKSFRASLPKTHSDLSMIFDNPYNWLNPVKAFRTSSLISAFYKATRLQSSFYKENRLQFVNKRDYFSFYCNKRFPFYVETAPINYYHFIYRQFLNTLFSGNQKFSLGVGQKTHAFGEREILSAIQSEVSKIFKSLDFSDRSDPFIRRVSYSMLDNRLRRRASESIVDISGTPLTEDQLFELERFYDSNLAARDLDDPIFSDPFSGIDSESIVDSSEPPLTEKQIENLEGTYCQPLSGIDSDPIVDSSEPPLTEKQIENLEGTYCQPLSNIHLADLGGIKSLSDIKALASKLPNFDDLDDDDLEEMNFEQSLSASKRYRDDLEGTNFDFDVSLSDLNLELDDLEETNFEQSLSDLKLEIDNLKKKNFDVSLSDLNLDDLEGINFDESLSDLNLADSEGTNFDVSLSDLNLDDLEEINLAESLSDINLADSEGTNFDEFLSAIHAKLQRMTLLIKNFNFRNFNSKTLGLPSSLLETFDLLELEKKIKKNRRRRRRRMRDILIKQNKLKLLYIRARRVYKRQMRMGKKKKKSAFSTRRSKRNLFKKYVSQTKWKLFKKYLPLAFTPSGFRFQTFLFLDLVSDLWRRIWDRERRRLRVSEINVPVQIWRKKWRNKRRQWTRQWTQWRQRPTQSPRQWMRQWMRQWTRQWTRQWMQWTQWKTQRTRQWKTQWTQWKTQWKTQWTQWTALWTREWTKSKEKWTPKFKSWATAFKEWDSQVFNLMVLVNAIITAWKELYPILCSYLKFLWLESKPTTPEGAIVILRTLFSLGLISFVCISLLQLLLSFLSLLILFRKGKSLIMDELMIESEMEELLAEYHPYQSPDLGLMFANFCIGLLEKILFPSPYGLRKKQRKFFNINLSPIINLIKILRNLIKILSNELVFLITTRSISHTSKEIYSFLRKRKKVPAYWDQSAYWVSTSPWVEDEERDVLMQFLDLRRKIKISEILWSLTSIDEFIDKYVGDVLPEMIEQPGEVYIRKVIDFHKKDLLNYQFDPSFLAEKRLVLALYHTMNYPQTSSGVDPVRPKPFSLRLNLAPAKNILVIGCIGLGRSYLVNYLAKNSYLPFITIFLDKFRGTFYRFDDDDEDDDEWEDYWEDMSLFFSRLSTFFSGAPDETEQLRQDMKLLHEDPTDWSPLRGVLNFLKAPFEEDDSEGRALEELSMEDQTDDMATVPYIDTVYCALQLELAKAMSPCLVWIPNIHKVTFGDGDLFSLGLLDRLLSWNCEKSSSSNNLVIASTHIPQQMDPSLIDPRRFNMCIKVRRPSLSQQQKHFAILAYTRGFRLDKEIFKSTSRFESVTLGSTAQDLAALTNDVLAISLSEGKSIIDSNTIRRARLRQTWDLRAEITPINNSRILFYQIGRVVGHYRFLNDCPIDPISIYMNKRFYQERDPYLYRWYYQLGMSLKKLTILIYVLTCSSGFVAQELWSPSELEGNNAIASGSLVDNNSDLVHGLLEIEGVLEGFLPTEKDWSQFDKDRVPRLRRSEPRNPSDMIHTGFWSMIDQKLIYEKDPLASSIVMGGCEVDVPKLFENFVVWSPRTWSPWGFLLDWLEKANANELGFSYWTRAFFAKQIQAILCDYDGDALEENDSDPDKDEGEEIPSLLEEKEKNKERPTFYELPEKDDYGRFTLYDYDDKDDEVSEAFLKSVYETRARIRSCNEQRFFRLTQFFWDPGNPLLILSDDPYMAPLFISTQEFFPELDQEQWFVTGEIKTMKKSWVVAETLEKHSQWLIQRQRLLRRPKTALSKGSGSFRSTALSESYQYLSKFLVSKRTVVNQMQKLLVRKRWLFPHDMQKFFNEQYHHHPAETRKN